MNNIPPKQVVLVSHKFLTQPDDDLVTYLNDRHYQNVLHICHSFIDAPDRKSYYKWYQNGVLAKEVFSQDFKGLPEPLIYIKEFLFTVWSVSFSGVVWDTYIGMDGLCVFFGNVLKFFGRVKQTIFWAIDFVPEQRFESKLKNWIYHTINTHGYEHSDQMWDLSPRMAEARLKYLNFPETKYKDRKVVPYGSWTQRIHRYSWDECEQHQLVFMGILLEKQGVQLVLRAIPQILKLIPNFKFVIIGEGPYRKTLEELVRKLHLTKCCHFTGKVEDHQDLEKIIARSGLAIAPYVKELDTWTYYADPGKVKTYLACGVPVVLTDLPWNSLAIEQAGAGVIVSESVDEIAQTVIDIMKRKNGNTARKHAVQFAQSYSYETMFKVVEGYL